jgi:hypothetical protein
MRGGKPIERPPKGEKGTNVRIAWARSLSNDDIGELLQMKLLEARAGRKTRVVLLNELVHEIKFRLSSPKKRGDAES